MNWVQKEITRYLTQNYDSLGELVGASSSDVLAFESVANVKFHSDYLDFLHFFGVESGGLLDKIPAHMDIKNLTLEYEEVHQFPDDFPPYPWVIIGAGYAGLDLVMNCNTGFINEHYAGTIGCLYSSSLKKLLCQHMFRFFKIQNSVNFTSFSYVQREKRAKVLEIIPIFKHSIYDCMVLDISDQGRVILDGVDFSAYVELTRDEGVMVDIAGSNRVEIEKFHRYIVTKFN